MSPCASLLLSRENRWVASRVCVGGEGGEGRLHSGGHPRPSQLECGLLERQQNKNHTEEGRSSALDKHQHFGNLTPPPVYLVQMSAQASPCLHRHNLGLDAKAVSAAAQICKDKSGAPAANHYGGSRPSQPGSGNSGGAGEGDGIVMHQPRPPATFNITAGVLRPSPRSTAACGDRGGGGGEGGGGDGDGGGGNGSGRSGRTNAELMEQVLLLSHVAQLAGGGGGGGSGSAQPLVRSGSLTKEHAP